MQQSLSLEGLAIHDHRSVLGRIELHRGDTGRLGGEAHHQLRELDVQLFVTALTPDAVSLPEPQRMFHVERGTVVQMV